ncbi:MAG: hypothetical protein JRJ04_16660 [Deltaproteobacteria bacterium]|nr:hypothetical protein [Deltaproteobacteria bacterium]
MKAIFLLAFIVIVTSPTGSDAWAEETLFAGQASVWASIADKNGLGMKYIPELRILRPISEAKSIDVEISVNAHTMADLNGLSDLDDNADIDAYRLWLRYQSEQWEVRLGLQKISFGSAKILRALMWFDRLDPRDPLALTDGVYGLLCRYYFLNNANIWLWGLYANDDPKGLEEFATDKDKTELGGRFQYPVPRGEVAVTYHRRHIDPAEWNRKMTSPMDDGMENRYAIDGSWDIGIGLWFEVSVGKIRIDSDESRWEEFFTVGTDYTFDIGPGIHILYEHFIQSTGPEFGEQTNQYRLSAVTADFNATLLDSITFIGLYDWKEEKFYPFFDWQRTYDNWKINISAFLSRADEQRMFSGDGIQIMLTYNH